MGLEGTTGGGNADDKGNTNNSSDGDSRVNSNNRGKEIDSLTEDQIALGLVEKNIEDLFTDQFDDAYAACESRRAYRDTSNKKF